VELAPGVFTNLSGGGITAEETGIEGGPASLFGTTMPVANPYAVPLTTSAGASQVNLQGQEPGAGPTPAQNTQVVQPGYTGPLAYSAPSETSGAISYGPGVTNLVAPNGTDYFTTSDFTGMTGLASLSQAVTSSSSPSLTTSSPNAQKVQVTVIAANPGSRATGQALVSSIRNLGVKI
jgi:hypothetical protein